MKMKFYNKKIISEIGFLYDEKQHLNHFCDLKNASKNNWLGIINWSIRRDILYKSDGKEILESNTYSKKKARKLTN